MEYQCQRECNKKHGNKSEALKLMAFFIKIPKNNFSMFSFLKLVAFLTFIDNIKKKPLILEMVLCVRSAYKVKFNLTE